MQRLKAEFGKHLLVLPELHQSVWRQNHKELICKDMKTIYILLITVLSWSLQACTAQCGKPDACTDSIPPYISRLCGSHIPLNIAPPNFRIGENADAFQTEIGTGETADILYTSKNPEVIIPTKKWKKLLQKPREKKYSSASPC